LDILAGLDKERIIFSQEFKKLQSKKRELHTKLEELNQALKSQDYNQFVLDELAQLQLSKTDYGKIENELLKLEQSEQLTSIYKKDGTLRSAFKDAQDVPLFFNNLNKSLFEFVNSQSPAKGDW
jgi:DNA repair ATPase RecN